MQSLTQVPPTMASNPTGFASPPEQPDSTSSPPETEAEAPPKQVALAMDRLSHASRLIANIRIGADRLLEAIFVTAVPRSNKPEHLISEEEASMRRHLQDLRNIGKKLEASGVLNGSLRTRGSPWGLHMPLVCPDGAIVAYSWKRQLAGQAAASAVDRTRLALKAFTDQKRRFFPHLEDDPFGQSSKKLCSSLAIPASHRDEASAGRSLSDILTHLEAEAPNLRIFTYQRLEWLKRVSSMGSFINENSADPSKEQNFNSSNRSRIGTADQVAVLELWVPSVLRVIVSLHPAGSINPDAVAFFSPDEGGKYIHARGFSVYHVFRCITEHADKALQYYLGAKSHASLDLLLHWICGYQTLFTKVCSKCGRLLVMDKPSSLLLPPVYRPYRQSSIGRHSLTQASFSMKDSSSDLTTAYHIGCSPDE